MNRPEYTYKVVRKRKRDFVTKILLPTVVTILLFLLTIFLIIIPQFKAKIMDEKRVMIKELTNSAWSVVEEFESYERQGLLSRAEAQRQAMERVRHLRYGEENKDYFWISDMHPNMVMHPYRNDLQGKSLEQFSDSHGKKLFLEFTKVVKEHGQGYVDYMWQWKDDSRQIVPKLSYVKGFAPWGWIVGTGIYLEDVNKNIRSLTHNLIMISLAISLIMVLLLSLIMQQSMKIEEARVEAENNLLDSMEKYKTLVQASTEGLLMVVDRQIAFANPRVQHLTGYSHEELAGQPFSLLLDETSDSETSQLFRDQLPTDGQYELMIRTREGAAREILVTVSSMAVSERSGTILILKDVTATERHSLKAEEYHELIGSFGLGFIKLALEGKGQVVEANAAAARMLGYGSVQELAAAQVTALFPSQDGARNLKSTLLERGSVRDAALPLKRKDGSEVMVSLALMVVGTESSHLLCEGIIEDISQKVQDKQELDALVAEMKSSVLFMEQPVASCMRKLATIGMNEPVSRAEKIMAAKNTDVLSVVTDTHEPVGILTFSDLRQRVTFRELGAETRVFEVMSAPVVSVDSQATLNDVVLLTSAHNIDHLVVTDGHRSVEGVVHTKDIPHAFSQAQRAVENRIRTARSAEELKNLFSRVIAVTRPLIDQNIQARTIGRLISGISGRITSRIVELAIEDLGKPPVEFVFVSLGSEGRREQTLETDQDNAIIYRDVPPEDAAEVQEYFARLSTVVCDSLHEAGFSYCRGNVMAKNPRWCVPLATWKQYVTTWVDTPDPQNILDVSIFFDFRPVFGTFELADELRRHVNQTVRDKQLFFYNFAENVLTFKSAVRITGGIATEKRDNRELFDLKYAITPVVMFARIYALFKNIDNTNTVERLTILNKEKTITDRDFNEILFGYNYLMQMRYRHQVEMADRGLPPDNLIDIRELTDIETALIKKIFASVSRLQSMLSLQFKKAVG